MEFVLFVFLLNEKHYPSRPNAGHRNVNTNRCENLDFHMAILFSTVPHGQFYFKRAMIAFYQYPFESITNAIFLQSIFYYARKSNTTR
jgi:hypothetical protein